MRAGSSSACDWRRWGCRGVREAAEKEHEGLKQAVRERMRALRADLEAVDSDGEEEPWARRPIADRCRHFPPGTSHTFSLCPACLHLPACPHQPLPCIIKSALLRRPYLLGACCAQHFHLCPCKLPQSALLAHKDQGRCPLSIGIVQVSELKHSQGA